MKEERRVGKKRKKEVGRGRKRMEYEKVEKQIMEERKQETEEERTVVDGSRNKRMDETERDLEGRATRRQKERSGKLRKV